MLAYFIQQNEKFHRWITLNYQTASSEISLIKRTIKQELKRSFKVIISHFLAIIHCFVSTYDLRNPSHLFNIFISIYGHCNLQKNITRLRYFFQNTIRVFTKPSSFLKSFIYLLLGYITKITILYWYDILLHIWYDWNFVPLKVFKWTSKSFLVKNINVLKYFLLETCV